MAAEINLALNNGFIDRDRFRRKELPSYTRRHVRPSRTELVREVKLTRFRHQEVKPETTLSALVQQSTIPEVQNKSHTVQDKFLQLEYLGPAKVEKTELTDSLVKNQIKPQHKQSRLTIKQFSKLGHKNKLQLSLITLACAMIIVGGYVSYSSLQANHVAQVQAAKLTKAANQAALNGNGSKNSSQAISTVKPTAKAIASYAVAPNLPKYLKIPAIGVDARVLQVGILASGALGTPNNVYDTAWYSGSAEPGQPGATLIDGHVSSWTSHGVFYNLDNLKAGDAIQVVKGDNSVVNYQVVKTVVYGAGNVDMQAAITPVNPSLSGLNLISCTGQVIKGTSLFNKRVVVYSQEIH